MLFGWFDFYFGRQSLVTKIGLKKTAFCVGLAVALSGCANPNQVAMQVGAPPVIKQDGESKKSTVSLRSLQVRRFDTDEDKKEAALWHGPGFDQS